MSFCSKLPSALGSKPGDASQPGGRGRLGGTAAAAATPASPTLRSALGDRHASSSMLSSSYCGACRLPAHTADRLRVRAARDDSTRGRPRSASPPGRRAANGRQGNLPVQQEEQQPVLATPPARPVWPQRSQDSNASSGSKSPSSSSSGLQRPTRSQASSSSSSSGGTSSSSSSSSTALPPMTQRPVRRPADVEAAAAPKQPLAFTLERRPGQQRIRQPPGTRQLHGPLPPAAPQQQAQPTGDAAAPWANKPWRMSGSALSSQRRQQVQQHQMLSQQYFRNHHLRVPHWIRKLAVDMLQLMASAPAVAPATEPPAELLQRLAALLPPYAGLEAAEQQQAAEEERQVEGAAQQQAEAAPHQQAGAEEEQQQAAQAEQPPQQEQQEQQAAAEQQQQQQQQQIDSVPGTDEPEQLEAAPAAGADSAGDVFSAELAQILQHYQQVPDSGGDEDEAPPSSEAAAAGVLGTPGMPFPRPERTIDEVGVQLLLRAVAHMGDGVRSAILVLLAADAAPAPYPSRSPAVLSTLLRLANKLTDHETAMQVLQYAKSWGVPFDRPMWQSMLDACAKAGRADKVQTLMAEMEAAGLPPDSVAHTILLMAHEKAGQWESAMDTYASMQRLGLQRNSFTYRALISALVGAGRLDTACEVLDWMRDDGVVGNAVVYQTLINAFLERGQQAEVDWLLGRMLRDNVRFSHQAAGRLTTFCLGRGQPREAFSLFQKVREMGLLSLDLPAGADGSDSEDEEEDGPELEQEPEAGAGRPAKRALQADAEDGSGAAAASSDLGSVSDAESELEAEGEGESEEDLKRTKRQAKRARAQARAQAAYSYCRMITACHKARLLSEAWAVYEWMLEDGLRPDRVTYSRLISVAAYWPPCHAAAEALYARLLAERIEIDTYMYLHLVTALGSGEDGPSRWLAVLRVLHGQHMGMPHFKDTHVQTVAVSLAAKHGRLDLALQVYRLMLQDGVHPKTPTFNALIAACMRAGQPERGFRFFEIMHATGVQADVVTVSTLISCCERMDDWQRAQEVWDWMHAQGLEPDTICYNSLISCMDRCNQPDRALAVFESMQDAGIAGSSATYAALCDVFARQGMWDRLRTAVQVKEWLEARGEDPAQLTYAKLMERAAEGGNWQRALELFEGMETSLALSGSQPNHVTYSAAITACARMADWRRALELKDHMLARGLPPSPVVYNSVLSACEAAGQLEAALEVLGEMGAGGVPRDNYTYSAAISTCCTASPSGAHLDQAMQLYREMQERDGLTPNIVVVNALLSVCAVAGDSNAAAHVYRHMLELGLQPDEITIHCRVEVAGRAERWVDGLRFFVAAYRDFGVNADVMSLNSPDPKAIATINLHNLTVLGTRVALRAWLLYLKRSAAEGARLPPTTLVSIITGWGRNSPSQVPRLKPEVWRMLQQDLGPPLGATEPNYNSGAFMLPVQNVYKWLETAQLGFSPEEEEEAWRLLLEMRELQQQRQAAQQQQQEQQTQQQQSGSR